jgi:hypothetical protein
MVVSESSFPFRAGGNKMASRRYLEMGVKPMLLLLLALSGTGAAAGGPSLFAQAMDAAMARMITGMQIGPTGNTDRDFAAMMIPHHQGAIDMAVAELKYGHNALMQRIAQEIIVDQQQEIAAMHLALAQRESGSSHALPQSSQEH